MNFLYGVRYPNNILKLNFSLFPSCSKKLDVGSKSKATPILLLSMTVLSLCPQHLRKSSFVYFNNPDAGSEI